MSIRDLSLSEAAVLFGGTLLYPDCHFSCVSTDTRTLREGDLFVALQGVHFNAHDFLESAALHACGLVVRHADKRLNLPQWVVPDTTVALGQLALMAREQFEGVVVGITGSSGKTTVKEMIAAILCQAVANKSAVLATQGNLNNQIGVPLTLLKLSREHRFAVVEMGANAGGEIGYLCGIAKPAIAMVNNVMPAHIAGFGNLAAVAKAKGEIYRNLPADGTAVFNLDEPWVEGWRNQLSCGHSLGFRVSPGPADFTARNVAFNAQGCCTFILVTPDGEVPVSLSLVGRHNLINALAAAACTYAAGAKPNAIAAGLAAVKPVPGRMQPCPGKKNAQVIDDSYNANPGSMKAAIDVLAALQGRRILAMGDMAELGDDAARLHGEVGSYAREQGIDHLYAVGGLVRQAVKAFGKQAQQFDSKAALGDALLQQMDSGTTVLVKGSRSAGMEDVVKTITGDH